MIPQPSSSPLPGDVPPQTAILRMITGNRVTQLIYVAAKLGIADLLKDGPRSCEELAKTAGAHGRSLYRVMRALASIGVFAEREDGRFALTPLAACLRSDVPDSRRFTAIMFGEEYHRIFGALLYSVKTGNVAFNHIYETGFFEHLDRNPEAAAVFHEYMSEQKKLDHAGVISAYDYSGISKLVDVGGGHGALISMILNAHPRMRGVLFDTSSVIAGAKAHVEAAGLASRCELIAGDFFESVPEGGDAYVLSRILHDWGDERAVAILRNCRRAMARTGRLLVIDQVIPPGNDPSPGKLTDILVLVLFGSQERTEVEFQALLASAGFRLTKVVLTGTMSDVIEAVPV